MTMLQGKIALITGAASGQGADEARLFVDEGAQVIMTDLSRDAGEALAKELGSSATFLSHDVSDPESWKAVVKEVDAKFGKLDILVNNAGIFRPTPIDDEDLETFDLIYKINQRGVFLGTRAVLPLMRKAGGGSIVNIASTAGLVALPAYSSYVASKYAVRGLTKAAALELGPDLIRVNAVLPGIVETPMIAHIDHTQFGGILPVQRTGKPRDIANMVCFLASDLSSYCTGGDFVSDGGQVTGMLHQSGL